MQQNRFIWYKREDRNLEKPSSQISVFKSLSFSIRNFDFHIFFKMLKIAILALLTVSALARYQRMPPGFGSEPASPKQPEVFEPSPKEAEISEPSLRAYQCGKAPLHDPLDQRIVNGSYSPVRGSYPFMVNIKMGWNHWCGGALYDKYTVISAAHCFWTGMNPSSLKLFFGDKHQKHGYEIEHGQERRYVRSVTLHPRYGQDGWNSNDIAILKLTQSVPFTDKIQPICLPTMEVQGGEKTVTMGWGYTKGTGDGNILSVVEVPIISRNTCKKWLGGYFTETMICAGFEEGMRDSCQGDSGGPLAMQNEEGFFELTGIVSWGNGCAQARNPGVYTDVVDYKDWINEVVGTPRY